MNVAGKSLQEIYIAASERLKKLQNTQKTNMHDATEAHLDERAGTEPESLKQLEERTAELEQEIRAFLQRGLEKVEKTVASECQENEKHINRLVESLVILSKKLSESISKLRETAESQLNDLCADSQQVHHSRSKIATSLVEQAGAEAIGELRTDGTDALSGTSATLDSSWQSVFDAESDAIDDLLECFDNDRQAVKACLEDAKSQLTERVDERTLKLEARSAQAQENVRSAVERVMENADRHAFDVDVRLKEGFSSLLYEMMASFDELANRASSEMVGLHESSMADLTMKSQELSRHIDSLAEDVTNSATDRLTELRSRGTDLIDEYTNELTGRLDAGNVFHRELEAERKHEVSAIWNELSELRTKFEQRLNGLAEQTLEKMRTICTEAENAIVSAQESCVQDSKSNAGKQQEAIDQAAKTFLARIEATRSAALESIAKAAGAAADAPAITVEPGAETGGDALVQAEEPPVQDAEQDKNRQPESASAAESGENGDVQESDHSEAEDESQSNPRPEDAAASGGESRRRKKRGSKAEKRSAGDDK